MLENRLPRKVLQYRPQDLTVVGKTSSCSCRTGIDYPKLRMEEEEEEEEEEDIYRLDGA